MTTLVDTSKIALTPSLLYNYAKKFNSLCLPIKVKCGKDYFTLQRDCICISKRGGVLDISTLKPNAGTNYYMTCYDLFAPCQHRDLHTEQIRLCDGMAVSYFLTVGCVKFTKNAIIFDTSVLTPVEYDDLESIDAVVVWQL